MVKKTTQQDASHTQGYKESARSQGRKQSKDRKRTTQQRGKIQAQRIKGNMEKMDNE